MMRMGYLIAGSFAVALAAAAVFLWTDFFAPPKEPNMPLDPPGATGASVADSRETQMVIAMKDVAKSGGYAATFQPDDQHQWNVDNGHRVERFRLADANVAFARISSTVPVDPNVVHLGSSVLWPEGLTQKFNGKKIQVGIVARQPSSNAAPRFLALFATRQAGNSGWRELKPTSKFELLAFEFDVPAVPDGYQNNSMLVIHADPDGQGRAVEILGVIVREAEEK